jgi:hypothetical protein
LRGVSSATRVRPRDAGRAAILDQPASIPVELAAYRMFAVFLPYPVSLKYRSAFPAAAGNKEPPEYEMSIQKVYKTSVNLPDVTIEALEQLAKKRSKSMSQVIRDAIATEQVLQEAIDRDSQILIKDRNGAIRQLILR